MLDNRERAGSKRHLRESQNICRAEKRNVLGTVAEASELPTELVDQEAPADLGPSTELAPVKGALAPAQSAAAEAREQLNSLQKKHDLL